MKREDEGKDLASGRKVKDIDYKNNLRDNINGITIICYTLIGHI